MLLTFFDIHNCKVKVGLTTFLYLKLSNLIYHYYSYSNFSNYRARFSMPNYKDTESFFFSWDMGPVHFIAVNTEAYYFLEYGLKPLSRQYEWLINDLEVSSMSVTSSDTGSGSSVNSINNLSVMIVSSFATVCVWFLIAVRILESLTLTQRL